MSDIAALNAFRRVPVAVNEPIRPYAPGSPDRAELKARLSSMAGERIEIPLIIGGKEIRTGKTGQSVMPVQAQARAGRLAHGRTQARADGHPGGDDRPA
jgi:hypothetical protein